MPEWKYLWSEAFKVRYAIAAWALNDCKHILEIGGYKTPITDFLDLESGRYESVTVYDPKCSDRHEMYEGKNGRVKINHYASLFQPVIPIHPYVTSYGIALLGLELHLNDFGWECLFRIILRAKRTVIEYAVASPTAIQQYARILKETGARVAFQVGIELAGNDFGDLTDSAPPMTDRRIVAIEC